MNKQSVHLRQEEQAVIFPNLELGDETTVIVLNTKGVVVDVDDKLKRLLIYTTNAIEGFNRQLRKVTKSKTVFPSDDSLLKMLYLATMDITKKWTGHRQDWGQIHSQLEIYFEERLIGRNL